MAVVAPYLCLVLLSVLWSIAGPANSDAREILNELIDWAVPVTVFFCLAASPTSELRVASAGRVMGFTVVMVAIYCGLQVLVLMGKASPLPAWIVELTHQGQKDFWWASLRVYGPFVSAGPNALGVFLLLPIAYAATRFMDSTGSARLGWGLVVLLGAAVIVGTYSRAAQLGFIVIVIMLPLLRRSPRGIAVVSVSLLLAAGLLAETTVGQHFRSLYGGGGSFDPDVGYRLSVWRVILSQVADHPLGLGFDGWLRASQHVVVKGLATLPGAPQPGAGQWMRELADRGIAGVVLLGLMIVGLIVLTIRAARRSRSRGVRDGFLTAAAAGFAAWMVAFVSDDYLMPDVIAGMFWYFAGIALAATRDDARMSSRSDLASSTVDPVAGHPHILPT
jgi:hypothetical protein